MIMMKQMKTGKAVFYFYSSPSPDFKLEMLRDVGRKGRKFLLTVARQNRATHC